MRIVSVFLIFVIGACSNTNFSGTSLEQRSSKDKSESIDDDDPKTSNRGENQNEENETKSEYAGNNEDENDDLDKKKDDSESIATEEVEREIGEQLNDGCIFAVSGGLLGYSASGKSYGSTFPKNKDGSVLKHGDTFDTVGGVYLGTSSKAYEFNKGKKEIDGAVNFSFDGIAVSPGVKITIKSGEGIIIYEGAGPYMAWSQTYGSGGNSRALPKIKALNASMPKWMVDYLENRNLLETLPLTPNENNPADLRNAHYVQVEKIKGVSCD